MSTTTRGRICCAVALGALLVTSGASAQSGRRVLLLWEGPPSSSLDAQVRDRLAQQPGVESVSVAGASLADILLAAGCDELSACAPRIARAARADLLVVRSPAGGTDVSLRVVDPEAPERPRAIGDPRDVLAERSLARSPRPLTWGLGGASLVLFAGAAIAGGLSIATGDAYSARLMDDADELERYALLARGQTEATTASVLLGLGAATAAMAIVMLAFDLGEGPARASIALAPAAGGARAEARWWF